MQTVLSYILPVKVMGLLSQALLFFKIKFISSKVCSYIYTVNSACNDIKGPMKIVLLHPDIIINNIVE